MDWISQQSCHSIPIHSLRPKSSPSSAPSLAVASPGGSAENLDLDPPASAYPGCGRTEGAGGAMISMIDCHEKWGVPAMVLKIKAWDGNGGLVLLVPRNSGPRDRKMINMSSCGFIHGMEKQPSQDGYGLKDLE